MKYSGEDTLAKRICTRQVEIKNADGLHMRPAMLFVDVASGFVCDVQVSNEQTAVDGKSIMQMTMLAATAGTQLTITTEGDDAEQAIKALWELVEERMFDEPAADSVSNRKSTNEGQ